MRKMLCAAAAMATVVSPAQAACWSSDQVNAALVRNLQTYLMVETLRCSAVGYDISQHYNSFVRGNRTALGSANDQLKAFFIAASGPVGGQSSYDRFTTSLANAYGGDPTSDESCSYARGLAHEASLMENSRDGLAMMADREGLYPPLPGGRCPAQVMARLDR